MRVLRAVVISESAFTVQGNGIHTAFVESVEALRQLDGIDIAVNEFRTADVKHIHTVGPGAFAHTLGHSKVVITAHLTPESLVGSIIGAERLRTAITRYLAWFYNLADAVIAMSQDSEEELRRIGVIRPITVIPNGIDVIRIRSVLKDKLRARSDLGIDPDTFLVLGVGQIQPRKAVEVFVECAQGIPEASFIWVGGIIVGRLAAARRIMRETMRSPPANMKFTGVLTRDKVLNYLAASDVFFLPSRHENCSMAVLEAASAGLPLILRDLPQHRSLFSGACLYGGDDGFRSLIRLCIDRQNVRRKLANSARDVAAKFEASKHAHELLSLYRAVVSGSTEARASG
jgi:1,2-diacylglycerol-3-alpha-glucose alpha-1,2-galactosyltransferase